MFTDNKLICPKTNMCGVKLYDIKLNESNKRTSFIASFTIHDKNLLNNFIHTKANKVFIEVVLPNDHYRFNTHVYGYRPISESEFTLRLIILEKTKNYNEFVEKITKYVKACPQLLAKATITDSITIDDITY